MNSCEDNERDLGVSVYEKANALLEKIAKAESEMWKFKSKEFENTLKSVVMQCNDILRQIGAAEEGLTKSVARQYSHTSLFIS